MIPQIEFTALKNIPFKKSVYANVIFVNCLPMERLLHYNTANIFDRLMSHCWPKIYNHVSKLLQKSWWWQRNWTAGQVCYETESDDGWSSFEELQGQVFWQIPGGKNEMQHSHSPKQECLMAGKIDLNQIFVCLVKVVEWSAFDFFRRWMCAIMLTWAHNISMTRTEAVGLVSKTSSIPSFQKTWES